MLFNRTINVISLAGVAFAIGMTVDNTIVVLESIMQAKKRGLERFDAAIAGVKDVWPAVLASTATTILVFAPILFVQQEAGQLYSDIAIAISGAIIASMLVAIFVVPVAIANFDKTKSDTQKQHLQLSTKWIKFVSFFIKTKSRAIKTVASFSFSILLLAYVLMPAAEYLPEGEEPKAFSIMIAPPSYNLSEMQRIGLELRDYFDTHTNAQEDDFNNGLTDMPPLSYYSMRVSAGRIWMLSRPSDPSNIQAMMSAITTKFKTYDNMRAFSSRGSII
jgi:multidrug efflux pump subunit AcrB